MSLDWTLIGISVALNFIINTLNHGLRKPGERRDMMKRQLEMKWAQYFPAAFPSRLHLRSDLHVARKVWHMGIGVLVSMIYLAGCPRSSAVLILGMILALDLVLESIRLRVPTMNEKVIRLWGPLMRQSETERFSGISYYLAAAILVIGIFPKPVAILSILYLACGDPIASLFGILYGKYGIRFKNGKTLVGTLAGIATCTLITLVFLNGMGLPLHQVLLLTLLGGCVGGSAELLPLEIDDNFSIPLVSGFVLWFAFILLGKF